MSETNIIRDANMIAEEINGIKEHVRKTAVQGAIEIGRRLHEAKALVPYGEWERWLEVNVNYSASTAQNMMRISDEYGRKESQALAEISYTQAVALLRLPAEEREQFVEEHDMDAMSTRELQQEIRRINEEREKLQLTIDEMMGLTPQAESGQKDDAESAELQGMREQLEEAGKIADEERARAKDLDKALKSAREQVSEAEARRVSEIKEERTKAESAEKERQKAVQELRELKKQAEAKTLELKRMEDELKAARESVRTVEVLPEAVQAELDKLRAQASRSGAESDMRAAYDNFVAAFERLMSKLEDAAQADAETAAKFRGAFCKATLQMAERMKG